MMISRKLAENIISLFTIKGMEYILAFITFPYLVRILQVERYGLTVFAQSVIQYFVLFTDYGFNLLGPREIAQHDNSEERGKVFSAIYFSKIILLAIAAVFFSIGILVAESFFNIDTCLYSMYFIMVIGSVLFPVWFFQGIQKMRYITLANIIARLFSVIGIFMLVKTKNDYIIAAFFQSITPLVAAVFSWGILLKNYPEVLVLPRLDSIKRSFVEAKPIFVSTMAINLYTASNVVILGMLTNSTVVGYYSGAKKIIDNIIGLISPVTQAIYPYVSKKASESRKTALVFLHKVVLILGGCNLALAIFILFFAEEIVRILLGSGYNQSVLLLRIMAFMPLIISLSNVFGIQTMLTFGMQREFSRILVIAAILNTCMVFPLTYFYGNIGVCIAITMTEVFVTASMWYVLNAKGIRVI